MSACIYIEYIFIYTIITGPIEAQVVVADLFGDGTLVLVVTDMIGNIVIVNSEGEVLWDTQLRSDNTGGVNSIPYTSVVGDVDGDGVLDIIVASVERRSGGNGDKSGGSTSSEPSQEQHAHTNSTRRTSSTERRHRRSHSRPGKGGCIWVFQGTTGTLLPGYPIHLPVGAVISGSVTVMDLHTR